MHRSRIRICTIMKLNYLVRFWKQQECTFEKVHRSCIRIRTIMKVSYLVWFWRQEECTFQKVHRSCIRICTITKLSYLGWFWRQEECTFLISKGAPFLPSESNNDHNMLIQVQEECTFFIENQPNGRSDADRVFELSSPLQNIHLVKNNRIGSVFRIWS